MKRKWGRWRRWRRWGRSEGIGRLQKVKGKEGLREVPTSMETNGGGEWWGVVGSGGEGRGSGGGGGGGGGGGDGGGGGGGGGKP